MQWIAVTERLPTQPYSVLAWVTKGGLVLPDEPGMRGIVSYFPDRGVWVQSIGQEDAVVQVSHWSELLAPPAFHSPPSGRPTNVAEFKQSPRPVRST